MKAMPTSNATAATSARRMTVVEFELLDDVVELVTVVCTGAVLV
jgi:hypothetical protein